MERKTSQWEAFLEWIWNDTTPRGEWFFSPPYAPQGRTFRQQILWECTEGEDCEFECPPFEGPFNADPTHNLTWVSGFLTDMDQASILEWLATQGERPEGMDDCEWVEANAFEIYQQFQGLIVARCTEATPPTFKQ